MAIEEGSPAEVPLSSSCEAAFFRVEGTLLTRPTAFAAAWLAANAQEFGGRLVRLGALGLSLPMWGADPGLGRRLSWSALRGMSEDRLRILGEEYFHTHISDRLSAVGKDLLARARSEGRRVVLVSDSIDVIVEHVADAVKADDWMSNRMEIRNGRATGRLAEPVVGTLSGTELRRYADQHGLDLGRCSGYGAQSEDGLLLSAVGLPCAVGPDRSLRRMAREHNWPVVEP